MILHVQPSDIIAFSIRHFLHRMHAYPESARAVRIICSSEGQSISAMRNLLRRSSSSAIDSISILAYSRRFDTFVLRGTFSSCVVAEEERKNWQNNER